MDSEHDGGSAPGNQGRIRWWLSHPVLFAFCVGALLGFSFAFALPPTWATEGTPDSLLVTILWPAKRAGQDFGGGFSLLPLLMAGIGPYAGNALIYGGFFSVVAAASRTFRKPEEPPTIR
jgi:hypothetical protein